MSRQTKKPAEQIPTQVKNVNLLPNVFATEPNKKMLDATLDVMTSKGQMLPFRETYGIRSASNKTEEFFVVESDEVRRESQANNMLVLKDSDDLYLGKVSYLDIENYFKVKNNELVDGTVLDKNINILDLPINPYKITDYSLFYWVDDDFPACHIHVEPKEDGSAKFSIETDLLGKPFATVVDDLTGKSLELQTGMVVYFTGNVGEQFLTVDEDNPVTFYVYGVGDYISLIKTNLVEKRIPNSYLKKRTWDKDNPYVEPPAIKWDSERWDGSSIRSSDPEYVTQEKFSANANHWQSIDHWYHITTIRAVAKFLGIDVSEIAKPENKAKRPIITFHRGLKLHNWPNNTKAEVKSLLPYNKDRYIGLTFIKDQKGYVLVNGDKIVFEENAGIYSVQGLPESATFTLVTGTVEDDGALIIAKGDLFYQKLIFKNNRWGFAQNKTEPNQTPLFEFFSGSGAALATLNESSFQGGVILGFKEGDVYDSVLKKYIQVSSIDFDLINESNPSAVSPNQLKFYTEVDKTWTYTDTSTGEEINVKGPYGYKLDNNLFGFYQPRRGLDITKQVQDLIYKAESEEIWSSPIQPVARSMEVIHVFYDQSRRIQFYTEVEGYGLVRFSSRKTFNTIEPLLPLVAGRKIKFICHSLPTPFAIYKVEVIDNISRPILLDEPYCFNNSITDGVMELDLRDSITLDGSTYIDNEIAANDTALHFSYAYIAGTSRPLYKTAIVKQETKWRFLQNLHIKDKTNPIYNGYEYIVEDDILPDGALSGQLSVRATPSLVNKIADGDKVIVDSIVANPVQKTAPLALTTNPLNKELSTINYYSLYQHATSVKSNATNSREYLDFESLLQSSLMGGGTFVKHGSPLSKFAVLATNMPYDFSDLLIRQGKHYDNFLGKLKTELEMVVNNTEYTSSSSFELLSAALNKIFIANPTDSTFWGHSNMIGWGEKLDNYRETTFVPDENSLVFSLSGDFEPISHRAGKELLLQITVDNKFLKEGTDYTLISNGDNYTEIQLGSDVVNKEVNIKQWYYRFKSQVPASLSKLGLYPVYQPEIYKDETYLPEDAYFLIRHDGSRYKLENGVDENNYPVDIIEGLLYEYELAVWANISYDVKNADFKDILERIPGANRELEKSFITARSSFVDETHAWLIENNIYNTQNTGYDETNGFKLIYQQGSGDDPNTTIVGSWRLIYKYYFDTDRPHTHPWEMLGFSVKPVWWDVHYSWVDPVKRDALETALRIGKISNPTSVDTINPRFARCNNKEHSQAFPVDEQGKLLPPNHPTMSWIDLYVLGSDGTWMLGTYGPYEQVFASTHRGIAAMAKTLYLRAPVAYVNNCWVPGQQIKNIWGHYIDRTTQFWQQGRIEHDYHRSVINGVTVYTSGIESLYGEFCILNNKDFEEEVIAKFNNIQVNKEFLLQGFSNKDNVRIQSTSINSQRQTLFIPEESYAVRTVKHYPNAEIFFSAMRIVFDGEFYSVYGFNKEYTYFPMFSPAPTSSTIPINVDDIIVKQKVKYDDANILTVNYGTAYKDRFALYDFIIGYGKYLESVGFIFEQPEGGDIRDWQLSAKQFFHWSNDTLAPGNYIDLNPCADEIVIYGQSGHLENLEGTNENSGQCVDRFNKPLFSKDLLVNRNSDGNIVITTKDKSRPVYGIKLTFSYYETVVHLDSTSVFDDIYFLPEQSTTKRSFVIGGKKTQNWTGTYFAPGYVFAGTDNNIIPNMDTMAEQGRNLLDVESVVIDPAVVEASRDQFGLSRNYELRQLFLQESNEVLFKNAITYNKGTKNVFASLEPLTHKDQSKTTPYEEYMVRLGEFGNTQNIDYYEFEILAEDLKRDPNVAQIVKFVGDSEATDDDKVLYIKDNSPRWVYKPQNKYLRFSTFNNSYSAMKTSGPVLPGDTNYSVEKLEEIDNLFPAYIDLWTIPHYDETLSYKANDCVRFDGKLYYALTTVSPGTWANNNDKFRQIDEPWLPNIYVNNYYKPNPDLSNAGNSIFTPGTWQILQTIDRSIGIVETCPGPNDTSKARIQTNKPHCLKKGEYVVIVNASSETTIVDGIWLVAEVEDEYKFYINSRISKVITTGKIFPLKPIRFKNYADYEIATGSATQDAAGYAWKKKFNPFFNAINDTNLTLDATPSGYDQTYPIAIIDDGFNLDADEVTYDYGNYKVYSINGDARTLVKEESMPVDSSDIEHLIIYDHEANKTVAKVEMYDPKKLIIPQVFKDDIDVINRVDPARYNRTTDSFKSVYTSLSWFEEMVGKRWWDTSTVSFADYETGSDVIKSRFWGATVNGQLPDIYEWTRSPVHPSKWSKLVEARGMAFDQIASGQAYIDKSLNTDNYHWVEEEEYVAGNAYTIYYFWVKNKTTIAKESTGSRVYTTEQLSNYMLNPNAAGIPWWAPISNNSIILKGVDKYLNNTSTVVQIKKKSKGNDKHQQWIFISEGHTADVIPEWIHVRFRDSISAHVFYKTIGSYTTFSGALTYKQSDIVKFNGDFYICRVYMSGQAINMDIYDPVTNPNGAWFKLTNVFELSGSLIGTWDGYFWDNIPWDYSVDKFWFWKTKNVPDQINLHRYSRLGNNIRPYIQGWFKNTLEARRTFIKQLNDIMVHVDIATVPNWGNTRLNSSAYKIADETVNVTNYWYYVDYMSEDFDPTQAISLVLESEADIYTSTISSGDYVKINTGIRDYIIYRKNVDQSFSVVYKTKGAIEFDKILYDPVSLSSWDTAGNDTYSWDFDLNSVYNAIVDSLRNEIFVGDYIKNYSKLICVMFRYIMSEQVNVDWLTKASTIQPVNLVGQDLTNNDALKRDEITVLTNFYSSVKSYRDKIRGGTVNKTVGENVNFEASESLSFKEFDSNGDLVDSYTRI